MAANASSCLYGRMKRCIVWPVFEFVQALCTHSGCQKTLCVSQDMLQIRDYCRGQGRGGGRGGGGGKEGRGELFHEQGVLPQMQITSDHLHTKLAVAKLLSRL